MQIGKLPETVLKRSVLNFAMHRRDEVIAGPSVGVDCAAIRAADKECYVLSTDPITGTDSEIGRHGILVTSNDLAAAGAEPLGVLLTVLLPPEITEEAIRRMMQEAEQTCAELNMEILGGHTEITDAVNKPVITVTGIGRTGSEGPLLPEQARPGDALVVTKWIGLEATAILASDRKKDLLKRFPAPMIEEAEGFRSMLSVLPESRIAVKGGAHAMHDITEGGIFGALWEMGEASGCGMEVDLQKIPIRQETVEICEYFDANPYEIMSSGSMLIASPSGERLVGALSGAGIRASVIGTLTEGNDRILKRDGAERFLDRPKPDALYRALDKEV